MLLFFFFTTNIRILIQKTYQEVCLLAVNIFGEKIGRCKKRELKKRMFKMDWKGLSMREWKGGQEEMRGRSCEYTN